MRLSTSDFRQCRIYNGRLISNTSIEQIEAFLLRSFAVIVTNYVRVPPLNADKINLVNRQRGVWYR